MPLIFFKKKKKLEVRGFEPLAFRMQSERDTTTPCPHNLNNWDCEYKFNLINFKC